MQSDEVEPQPQAGRGGAVFQLVETRMQRMCRLVRWGLMVLLAAAGAAHSAPPAPQAWLDAVLSGTMAYMSSPASVVDPADGTLSDLFTPVARGPLRLGLSSRAHWLRLQIANLTEKSVNRCLDVGAAPHADIRVFADSGQGRSGTRRWRELAATPREEGDGLCSASSHLYGPLEIASNQTMTILIRVRSLQPLTLNPHLLSPAYARAESQRWGQLSLIATVTTGLVALLMLLWSAFGGRLRHGAMAANAVAAFLWIATLDNALPPSTVASFLQSVSPFGALGAGTLFAVSYLFSYQQLFSGGRHSRPFQRASGWLMATLGLLLLLVLLWDARELVALQWALIGVAPFLTLACSWRFWMRHETGSTQLFAAHVGLLLFYAWQMHDAMALDLLPSPGPELQITWTVALFLHHASWMRAMEIHSDPDIHPSGAHSSVAMLEAEVGRRTEDLRIARESAERMAALQRDFLATMSHELRTPLASVVGLCRMLGDDAALPERARKDMGTVERLAVHLLRMVDDGLAYVRQRGKEEPVMRKPVNMRFLLRDMESVSRWLSQRQGNEFTMLKVRSVPPVLHFDEQRLRQVLINLVSNAGRYCHNGQVSLGVSFKAADGEPQLSWTISDSGRGMSEEELKKVFEPFVKSRDSQGLGLGLALVKKLVGDMEGTIRVQSQIGLGTQFYLTIPVSTEGESLEEMRLDSNTTNQHNDAAVSRPMALLPDRELDLLQLGELREHLRLGQLSEIEEWIKSVETTSGLSPEAERFIRKVRQAAADVDLTAIGMLIDQIDTPLN